MFFYLASAAGVGCSFGAIFDLPFAFFLCPHICISGGSVASLCPLLQSDFAVIAWPLAISLGCLLGRCSLFVCFQVDSLMQSPRSSSTVITLAIPIGCGSVSQQPRLQGCVGLFCQSSRSSFRWGVFVNHFVYGTAISVYRGAFSISQESTGAKPFRQT